ncbi:hypothetical protein JSQ81_05340 [Sporosarcina sp. Marseille-Q4063]|uniref:hypothetical protein n=1 Tax=Sporosarcina sp. Marseille-Q4063 TaxID=2810514 RepID=UPI001BB04AFB|nr:hypothetical protein [Sporosarcina sp. Marseille-Q4063]QUW22997.1 hypothetical protein JSQ81_05340 [Sporosarcina sp. Marseille-Q4063]
MTKDNRKKVKVESEMRTKGISKMIDEGGLGAEEYYEIKKPSPSAQFKTEGDENEKEDNGD